MFRVAAGTGVHPHLGAIGVDQWLVWGKAGVP